MKFFERKGGKMWLAINSYLLLTVLIVCGLAVFERRLLKKLVLEAAGSYYDLENWDEDLYVTLAVVAPLSFGYSIIIFSILLPIYGLTRCFENVKYAIINLKYYL